MFVKIGKIGSLGSLINKKNSLEKPPFLKVDKNFVWLQKANFYENNFNVLSNLEWNITKS